MAVGSFKPIAKLLAKVGVASPRADGYWRFDRTAKETGVGPLVEGMSLRDFHAPFYVAVGRAGSESVSAGQTVQVPLYASFLTDAPVAGDSLTLRTELYGWNSLGERRTYERGWGGQ